MLESTELRRRGVFFCSRQTGVKSPSNRSPPVFVCRGLCLPFPPGASSEEQKFSFPLGGARLSGIAVSEAARRGCVPAALLHLPKALHARGQNLIPRWTDPLKHCSLPRTLVHLRAYSFSTPPPVKIERKLATYLYASIEMSSARCEHA